jgi:hypothetical protein
MSGGARPAPAVPERAFARASEVNPEAGSHAITADPRELAAAIAAGRRSYERFPYYALRYGERGDRFTRSDSGWLALLAREDEGHVIAQARWLGELLSTRGMPRLLLEEHLAILAEELARAVPEGAERYARLVRAADALRVERVEALADEELPRLAAFFEARAGSLATRVPGAGVLAGAAVADEACGIDGAVDALVRWLGDRARHPPPFADAVEATVARARALAR